MKNKSQNFIDINNQFLENDKVFSKNYEILEKNFLDNDLIRNIDEENLINEKKEIKTNEKENINILEKNIKKNTKIHQNKKLNEKQENKLIIKSNINSEKTDSFLIFQKKEKKEKPLFVSSSISLKKKIIESEVLDFLIFDLISEKLFFDKIEKMGDFLNFKNIEDVKNNDYFEPPILECSFDQEKKSVENKENYIDLNSEKKNKKKQKKIFLNIEEEEYLKNHEENYLMNSDENNEQDGNENLIKLKDLNFEKQVTENNFIKLKDLEFDKNSEDSNNFENQNFQNCENSSKSAETVYAIRTHFSAVIEYLLILLDNFSQNNFENLKNVLNTKSLIYKKKDLIPILYKTEKKKFFSKMESHFFIKSELEKNFTKIEKKILSNCQNFEKMENLIKIQKHYHKSIFDCFFEEMTLYITETSFRKDYQKNQGVALIKNFPNFSDLLQNTRERVLENAGFLCGVIRDKEDSMMGDIRYIDDFTLFNLKEERMMRLIIFTILSDQKVWVCFENEKRDLVKYLEEAVFDHLVQDLAGFLS